MKLYTFEKINLIASYKVNASVNSNFEIHKRSLIDTE